MVKKQEKRLGTIDEICQGLRILERYKPTAIVSGSNRRYYSIELQEVEYENITDDDSKKLQALNWATNGAYLWNI